MQQPFTLIGCGHYIDNAFTESCKLQAKDVSWIDAGEQLLAEEQQATVRAAAKKAKKLSRRQTNRPLNILVACMPSTNSVATGWLLLLLRTVSGMQCQTTEQEVFWL